MYGAGSYEGGSFSLSKRACTELVEVESKRDFLWVPEQSWNDALGRTGNGVKKSLGIVKYN
jgi:hypothetical protein